MTAPEPGAPRIVTRHQFPALLDAVRAAGYTLIGPTVRDQAIVYDEIEGAEDLPVGWTDSQQPGAYRLERRDDNALFGYTVGPHAWKKFLLPPVQTLWTAHKTDDGFAVDDSPDDAAPMAFLGVRSCELHAIAIQDRVLIRDRYPDSQYAARRAKVFTIAVNCTQAGNTCFCVSMETGPRVTGDYDVAVTELLDADRHDFLVEAGTPAGADILAQVESRPATQSDCDDAEAASDRAAQHMGRSMDTTDITDLLYRNAEHPRWDEVAARCLGCTNCTLVCPTCFCTAVEDVTDLTGDTAQRVRRWDSCFNADFSYIHGGVVRQSLTSRYRQWLTHKLGSWHDQFGSSGCVGCGRCLTWCPVGIDITEEVAAIRATDHAHISPQDEDL